MLTTSDLQPIIMAAGKGTRMPELLSNQPKCLLLVGNKPMIQYPLEMLVKANFKNASVYVLRKEEDTIRSVINKLNLPIEIDYMSVDGIGDWATADNFRKVRTKISKDLLIISSDIITDYDLTDFIRFYREKDASLLCLFSAIPSIKEDMVPAKKLIDNREYDIVGFDRADPNRLVYFEPDAKFTDTVAIKKSFLKHCPNIKFHTNHQDAHIYIMKNWLLNYLDQKRQVTSIKGDLVPSIVRKQFRKPRYVNNNDSHQNDTKVNMDLVEDGPVFFRCLEKTELEYVLSEFEKIGLECCNEDKTPEVNSLRCYGLVTTSGLCIRTNNILRFCEANRVILKQFPVKNQKNDKIKSYVDGIIGSDTIIGEKCSIKKTVIGTNCKIASNVTLQNCILLDKVHIQEGVILKNSLICSNTVIEAKSELSDCIVGSHRKIDEGSKHNNEMLIDMDI